MSFGILLSFILPLVAYSTQEERVYYVSSLIGSGTQQQECGSVSSPCASLHGALNRSLTMVDQYYSYSGGLVSNCYTTDGIETGTEEGLSIVLLDGDHTVDPLCIANTSNLTITALSPSNTKIYSTILGNTYGIIAIFDSHNIAITNLTFIDSVIGRSSLYARNSTGIHISDCSIPVYSDGALGIWLEDPYGVVTISRVTIYGNSVLESIVENEIRGSPGIAFKVSLGLSTSGIGLYYPITVPPSVNIMVEKCVFERIKFSEPDEDNYDYRQTSQRSKVMRVSLGTTAIGNSITFSNCVFQENVDSSGSIALVTMNGDESSNNTVQFQDCSFINNMARFGGGVAAYFSGDVTNNAVSITDSVFLYNKATREGGGVFMASIAQYPQTNNLLVKDCFFFRNSAVYGAAMFLFNDPVLYIPVPDPDSKESRLVPMRVGVDSCRFRNNTAYLSEGVISTLRIQLEMNGMNILTGNDGSSILAHFSTIVISNEFYATFNKAEKGAVLKILDNSLVDLSSLVIGNFTDNQALFSGGAVYADASSTTITADQYNHTNPQLTLGNCFILMPLFNTDVKFYFARNKAIASGNDFFIYCVRSCLQNYFIPHPFDQYVFNAYYDPVVIETDDPLAVTSTGPTFLFFYGASTKCYKQVGEMTYLFPNCSHQLLMDNLQGLSQLSECVQDITQEMEGHFIPGHGMFHPLDNQLILPWAGIGTSWVIVNWDRDTCAGKNPGSLTLSPAPGEQFDLMIQLTDELLNTISSTVFLEIQHTPGTSPGVLVQINGLQWAYDDRLYFTPNSILSGIALVGLPGSKGFINIVSDSQILGLDIILQIPFQLSQCPLGFYPPPLMGATRQQVDDLILHEYGYTQRVPSDQPLACQCFTDYDVKFSKISSSYSSECIGGYTVSLNGILWAGLIPFENTSMLNELPTTSCYSNRTNQLDSLTILIEQAREAQLGSAQESTNLVDVVQYRKGLIPGGDAPVKCYTNYTIDELVNFRINGEFSLDICARGFCRGSTETSWFLSDIHHPCTDNREGVVCGQCKTGLSLTLTSTKCQDCSNPRGYVPLITTLILGLLLVILVVAFNVGVTPTIDSFLFFIQAVYIVVSGRLDYRNFELLSFFNLDFTFNQCILSHLKALPRLLFQYATPIYILLLLMIVLILSKIKGFAKIFGNHSILKSLWLLVLISYVNIANTTFEILNCQTIGPRNIGFSEKVLVYDASIVCWTGLHLPFAIIAVLLLIFLIVPFPMYSGIAIRVPKWKPITDVYCGEYRDEQRYWIIWNLLRRILIVMASVFVSDFVFRHFALLLLSVVILSVSVSTWSYMYWIDNAFGMFVLLALLVFCIVTQPEVYQLADKGQIVSWSIVGVVGLATLLMLSVEVSLWWLKHKGKTQYTKHSITPTRARNKLLKLVTLLLSMVTKHRKYVENDLEDSVHSNQYYERYKEFREPLIDEESFSSVAVARRSNPNVITSQELCLEEPGINSSLGASKTIVTHSIITRDVDGQT